MMSSVWFGNLHRRCYHSTAVRCRITQRSFSCGLVSRNSNPTAIPNNSNNDCSMVRNVSSCSSNSYTRNNFNTDNNYYNSYDTIGSRKKMTTVSTKTTAKHMQWERIGSCRSTSTTSSNDNFDRTSVSGPYGNYLEEYKSSIESPELFWSKAADNVSWFEKPTKILEYLNNDSKNFYNWFPDGKLNISYNCLDVQVHKEGRGDQNAIIYDSPITHTKEQITYRELLEAVSSFAAGLKDLGVTQGDRVIIYMPMIPQAIIAMLACTRIGAVHSVVFGGFAANELATRITDCQPKVIISASAGIEPGPKIIPYKPLLDKALEIANHNVKNTIIVQRSNVQTCTLNSKIDMDYDEFMTKNSSSKVDAVPLPSNHPHYILYTSGTTGLPKGVIRDTAGTAVSLKYTMGAFYDTNPGEVFWAASDIGWVVGHSYIVYAPLLNGCTTILYEGKPVGTPDASSFWRVIQEYNVKTMFTAPTALRAIKQKDPSAKLINDFDISSLKTLFLAGEHCDPDTLHWIENAFNKNNDHYVPVIDHWWQTELGWPGAGNAIGLGHFPIEYGACAAPVPGYNIEIKDDHGNTLTHSGELGDMVIKLPLPPGTLSTLYNNDKRYVTDYLSKYPGYYDTGDAAYFDKNDYIHIMGRTDDIINTAGHRLSTGTMEEILMEHPDVADCAVIPVKDELKGQVPVGFVVINSESTTDEEIIKKELIAAMRDQLGPVASFKKVGIVNGLPKTRSGKILRSTMSKIANGFPYKITPTIENPKIFDEIGPQIQALVGREKK